MIQSSFASLVFLVWRILTAFGRGVWLFFRPGLRVISGLLFLAATIALVADVTRWQTGVVGPTFQSLEYHIQSAAPATLGNIGLAVGTALHPVVWDPLIRSLLAMPAWMTLLVLAALLTYAARERRQVSIFIN